MNVEWDEELIADREHYFHQCDDQACQADQQAVRIARAQHAEVARLTAEREEQGGTMTDFTYHLEALEDARRAAVRRERDSTRRGQSCADYDRGIADGLRQAISILELIASGLR